MPKLSPQSKTPARVVVHGILKARATVEETVMFGRHIVDVAVKVQNMQGSAEVLRLRDGIELPEGARARTSVDH